MTMKDEISKTALVLAYVFVAIAGIALVGAIIANGFWSAPLLVLTLAALFIAEVLSGNP